METTELLDKFTRQMRIDITFPDMEKESSPQIVRFLRPAPGMSQILYTNLDEAQADSVIEEQISYFATRNLPFIWEVYAYDTPPDLLERLKTHGFTPDPQDAVMVLDLAHAVLPSLDEAKTDVRRIETDQLGDVVKVLEQVWGRNFDWIYQRLGSHLAVLDYLSIFVAYANHQPGCVGWIYYHPGSEFASLWGGSTVQGLRNQGLYTSILAARACEAVERGVRYLVTDASPMSQSVLAQHGFFQLTTVHQCEYIG